MTDLQTGSFMFSSVRFYFCACPVHRSTSSISITHSLNTSRHVIYVLTAVSNPRWMLRCEPVSQANHRNSMQTHQDSQPQDPASKSVKTHIVYCFRVRWNLQSAHRGPLVLNISLTINTAVIDVKPSHSEKGERRRKRGEDKGGEGERSRNRKRPTHCRHKAIERI